MAMRCSSFERFRFLDWTYPDVAANLALDEALLQQAEDEAAAPVLRIWELPSFAIVLGASCRLTENVRLDTCESDRIAIARRSSGGGTVVIGPGALNVTVVLAQDAGPDLGAVTTAQSFVLERIAEALRARGNEVRVQGSGDLTIGSKKVGGSAQRRLRRHFLVHASILYQFPVDLIARYTAAPSRQPAYRQNRSHQDFVTNLQVDRAGLVAAIRAAWLAPAGEAPAAVVPEARVEELVATKFGAPSWTERL
jgi:lipoate-protein ligase A